MKLRRLVTFAMAVQVVVTAAALLASYALTGTAGFGIAQIVAITASGAVGAGRCRALPAQAVG
ncbi:hypothetical protein GWG65_14770 [Bradyrhizobium sp. CSA207]|nr:hypothetical protein [Bradyrhizobium sp. CSA207]